VRIYQIRLDVTNKLVHLEIPHKRVHIIKTAYMRGSSSASAASSASHASDSMNVLDLLGGSALLDEMQVRRHTSVSGLKLRVYTALSY
jgi:hypothetical protein